MKKVKKKRGNSLIGSKKLDKLLATSPKIYFDDNSKIILMSDCHRGNGTWSDDFFKNRNIFKAALNYYYNNNYIYIELGDGDELWENKDMKDIVDEYPDLFQLLIKFHKANRLYLIYGNHDRIKKKQFFFRDINSYEGLVLRHLYRKRNILLIHGHQTDFLNYRLWPINQFLVRYLWKNLELLGFQDPSSAAKNNRKGNIIDKRISFWSKTRKQVVIAGHTHRALFPNAHDSIYFNTGSCVFPSGITGVEIDKGMISLIKWSTQVKNDGILHIDKTVLQGSIKLVDYFCKF